jgi:hypothetical protein
MNLTRVKWTLPFLLIFLILVGSGSSSYGKSSATIVFSGEMNGYIEPCGT